MQTYTFDQLDERGQENAIDRYYADADYLSFTEEKAKEYPEEVMLVSDWANERGLRFTIHGERVA